jgi:hypothetical protein
MKTNELNQKNRQSNEALDIVPISSQILGLKNCKAFTFLLIIVVSLLSVQCNKEDDNTPDTNSTDTTSYPPIGTEYNIDQAISDQAQMNTIAFDGLAFMTGNLGSQSFLPPGKVADYSGFQCFRDNDLTKLGHNTSFVTIIAFNILNILTEEQINMYVDRANEQIELINAFAYKRYPLLKAFRRLFEGDLPDGTTGLDKDKVMAYAAELYKIDGQISYNRAQLFGEIINSLTKTQKAELDELVGLGGIGNWPDNLSNPLEGLGLPQDVNVAVMTYASEMYAWYAGNTTTDVYFCPERHGTYFGSFFLKDWPAMGNPNYTIDEKLTAEAGQNFFNVLTTPQADSIKDIVDLQRNALNEIVAKRTSVSKELRKFLAGDIADSTTVYALSERYGELDGEMSYYMATRFAEVYSNMSSQQRLDMETLAGELGYMDPTGGFLYSQPVAMPTVVNTDFMFK